MVAKGVEVANDRVGLSNDPLVSVVIVTWNRRADVLEAVRSVHRQNYSNYEIVVVDNASTDGTVESLREVQGVNVLALESNAGAAGGRSVGMAAANGEVVFMLDSDGSLAPDTLSLVVTKFRAEPNLALIACKILNAYTNEVDSWIYPASLLHHSDRPFLSYSFCSAGAAVRREAAERVGSFWDKLFIYREEDEYSLRLWDAGYDILYWPEAVVYHRRSPSERVNSDRRDYYDLRNSLYIYLTRYPWWMLTAFAPLKIASSMLRGARRGSLGKTFRALSEVRGEALDLWRQRRPIHSRTARKYLSLQRKHGPLAWDLGSWLKHKT